MTTKVKVEDAAEMLPDLLARVERGEEVVLERDGVPVVRMTGCESDERVRSRDLAFGNMRGQAVEVDPDWWRPMTDAEVDEWLGEPGDD